MPSVRFGRSARVLSLLFSILAITVVIGIFPMGLRVLGGATAKWERLSFIGQT